MGQYSQQPSRQRSGAGLVVGLMIVMALGFLLFRRSLHRQWRSAARLGAIATAGGIDDLAATAGAGRTDQRPALGQRAGLFTWGESHAELRLLIYLVLLGVMASVATFLAPVLQVFAASWRVFTCPCCCARWITFRKGPYLLAAAAAVRRHSVHATPGARGARAAADGARAGASGTGGGYREAKEQAENALAEKNWFISAASHDLRQPLHAMGLMPQAAHQRNQDDELAQLLQENAGLHARSGLHVQRPDDGSVAT